jgi:hypothetical protein
MADQQNHRCNHARTCATCRRSQRSRGKTISGLYWKLQFTLDMLAEMDHPAVTHAPIGSSETSIETFMNKIRASPGAVSSIPVDMPKTCGVCFEAYDTGGHFPVVVNCGHTCCADCLTRLRSLECPLCRKRITIALRLYGN